MNDSTVYGHAWVVLIGFHRVPQTTHLVNKLTGAIYTIFGSYQDRKMLDRHVVPERTGSGFLMGTFSLQK